MKKLLLSLSLVLLSVWVSAAPATYSVWDGSTTEPSFSAQVYDVSTASELAWLAANNDAMNGYPNCVIRLHANIDLSGRAWKPLGTAAKPFAGTLDGQNHLIKGLRIVQGNSAVGLMGMIAPTGVVSRVGIAGGKILANGKRQVGALAGVNNGTIQYSWSMVEIAIAGTQVGGLVGVNNGTINYCYNAGLLLQAVDTIGGLAGVNSGTISNSYNTGYALNGGAITGHDEGGQYQNCYYDRHLYYQPAVMIGTTPVLTDIQPIDETAQMFGIFSGDNHWVTSTDRYPMLSGFETTDAAIVSASPALMGGTGTAAEHANDFLTSFELCVSEGETWSLKEGTADMTISGTTCTIRRSCDGGHVLLAAAIGDEEKVMYFRPRRLEDFTPARMTLIEDDTKWCNPSYFVMQEIFTMSPARGGWIYAPYQYRFVVDSIDLATNDTIRLKTLSEGSWTQLETWYDTAYYETTVAGAYILRLESRDEGCHTDWQSNGHYYFEVSEQFDGGDIGIKEDTVYAESVAINVSSVVDASGGIGDIGYVWLKYDLLTNRVDTLWEQHFKDLSYTLSEAGKYRFTRVAYDEKCQTDNAGHPLDWGYYYILLRDPIDAGDLIRQSELETLCINTDGDNDTLYATAPSGGSGVYQYRWLVNGAVLSGATKAYLPIADIHMVNGQTYTIIRQVTDDYRLSTWQNSDYSQTITVSAGFSTGSIETGTLPQYCVMGGTTQSITVSIGSTADAAGDGTLEYAWYRAEEDGSNPVEIATTASLNATFPATDIETGKTYRYYRMVRDAACGSSWVASTGVMYQYYRANDHKDSTLTICSTLFPYRVYYPDPTAGPYYHLFTKEECGIPYTFSNILADPNCYPTMTITVDSLEAPEIMVDTVAKLCQDAGTITIYYEVVSGSPDSFYIELSPSLTRYFDNKNYVAGTMEPVGAGETGKIVLTNVNRIGMGTNYMFVQVGNRQDHAGEESCFSMMHKMNLEFNLGGYIHSKYDKVLFVDNEPNTAESLTFVRYQWYKDGVRLEGETGQYYHENGATLRGTYYADLTTIENGVEVTYQSCDIYLPVGSSGTPTPPREQAQMYLQDAQVVIELNGVKYDIYGRILQ